VHSGRGEISNRVQDEYAGGGLFGVLSKDLVQHRLGSGCRTSDR